MLHTLVNSGSEFASLLEKRANSIRTGPDSLLEKYGLADHTGQSEQSVESEECNVDCRAALEKVQAEWRPLVEVLDRREKAYWSAYREHAHALAQIKGLIAQRASIPQVLYIHCLFILTIRQTLNFHSLASMGY